MHTRLSGSPIIQDGTLVGAVVCVAGNDPTAGYGIFLLLACRPNASVVRSALFCFRKTLAEQSALAH